jgi:hypothetical protein
VLLPDPKVIRTLLTRYASAKIAQGERETPATVREVEDVSYTLCVTMDAAGVHEAVAKADAYLMAAMQRAAGPRVGVCRRPQSEAA